MNTVVIGNNGSVLISDGNGNVDWTVYPFIKEFHEVWADKYASKCENFCHRYVKYTNGAVDGYESVYRLSELLYKLRAWKP
jgi:hypothetical protein